MAKMIDFPVRGETSRAINVEQVGSLALTDATDKGSEWVVTVTIAGREENATFPTELEARTFYDSIRSQIETP